MRDGGQDLGTPAGTHIHTDTRIQPQIAGGNTDAADQETNRYKRLHRNRPIEGGGGEAA